MGKYYSVNLKVKDRKCVVVGGGKVAERKINLLVEKDALVMVVSPQITSPLAKLRRDGKINHSPAQYLSSHLKDAFLAIAATDERTTNSRVAKDPSHLGELVNVVDCPAESSFILPAILSRGDLTIAVSTAGKSPALARKIKEDLGLIYSDEYGDVVDIVAKAREKIKRRYSNPQKRVQVWREIMEKI